MTVLVIWPGPDRYWYFALILKRQSCHYIRSLTLAPEALSKLDEMSLFLLFLSRIDSFSAIHLYQTICLFVCLEGTKL